MFKRKIISIALCICLLSMPIAVNAQDVPSQSVGGNYSVFSTYTSDTQTTLDITSGTASILGTITGYQGSTTKVKIYLYLQQYKNGSWKTVDSWSQSFNKYRGSLEESTTVTEGYKHRVKGSYYAYSDSDSENTVGYSGAVTY